MKTFIARSVLFWVGFAIVGELFFRFVVPGTEVPITEQNKDYGFLHYDTSEIVSGYFTTGRLPHERYYWEINNEGFLSHHDYKTPDQREKPVIAYFGSSFIEGFYSNIDEQIAYFVEECIGDQYEVYNFAFSNSVPSEHLAVSRFARDKYEPDIFIFFSAPWHLKLSTKKVPFRKRFSINDGEVVEGTVGDFVYSRLKRTVKYSAMLRYLYLNARFRLNILNNPNEKKEAEENAAFINPGTINQSDIELREKIGDYLVRTLREENPDATIIMAGGTPYSDNYPEKLELENRILKDACERYNCDFLNVSQVFKKEYELHGTSFYVEGDPHWNTQAYRVIGHAICAFVDSLNTTNDDAMEVNAEE